MIRYALIEDGAGHLEPRSGGFVRVDADVFDDEATARLAQEDANRDAERHGLPVVFRLFTLTEVGS